MPAVCEELRKLAAVKLADEKLGQTLQVTALVHDAYLRLTGADPHEPTVPDTTAGDALLAARPRTEPATKRD